MEAPDDDPDVDYNVVNACDVASDSVAFSTRAEPWSSCLQRRAVWVWARREGTITTGAGERTGDNLVAEEVEGEGDSSLWRVLCVLEGRPSSEEEVAVLRKVVVMRVDEGQAAGTLKEELLPQEAGRKKYQRVAQGRRMGGPPEVEAWVMGRGCSVPVYRDARNGKGYRKLKEFQDGSTLGAGILWSKRRVYAVLWGIRGEEHAERATAATVSS